MSFHRIELVIYGRKKKCLLAFDNSSQLCRNADGRFEMAGGDYTHIKTLPLGKGHNETLSQTYGLLYIYPYLFQPFCRTYWHGCIAGYYHLIPMVSFICKLPSCEIPCFINGRFLSFSTNRTIYTLQNKVLGSFHPRMA